MARCDHPDVVATLPGLSLADTDSAHASCGSCGETVSVSADSEMLWLHDQAGSVVVSRSPDMLGEEGQHPAA